MIKSIYCLLNKEIRYIYWKSTLTIHKTQVGCAYTAFHFQVALLPRVECLEILSFKGNDA